MKHPLVLYMEHRLVTQSELAAQIGVAEATMSRWIRGLRFPAGRYAEAVEKATRGNVKYVELVEWWVSPARTVIPSRQTRAYARRYGWVKAVYLKKKKKRRSK